MAAMSRRGGRPGKGIRRGALAGLARLFAPVREARGLPKWVLWGGAVVTVLFLIMAVFAPLIAPFDFDQYRNAEGVRFGKQASPTAEHLFGTTVQSTDVLSRVVYGSRTALSVLVLSVAFSMLVGVPLGLVSGYFGGKIDRILVLVMDALFAFPYLLLAIVISFLLSQSIGRGVVSAAIAISVVYAPQYFRVI
jgi:peptide/nickel transport system permease protein